MFLMFITAITLVLMRIFFYVGPYGLHLLPFIKIWNILYKFFRWYLYLAQLPFWFLIWLGIFGTFFLVPHSFPLCNLCKSVESHTTIKIECKVVRVSFLFLKTYVRICTLGRQVELNSSTIWAFCPLCEWFNVCLWP